MFCNMSYSVTWRICYWFYIILWPTQRHKHLMRRVPKPRLIHAILARIVLLHVFSDSNIFPVILKLYNIVI